MKKLLLCLILFTSGMIGQISPPPSGATGAGAFTLPTTSIITSTVNNSAMSAAFSGQNNSCSPLTDYQAGQGANFATVGIQGCVKVAVGSTQQGALGVFGSATNSSITTNAVAGYFPSFAGAAGSGATDPTRVRIWGVNSLLADKTFLNVLMTNELDFNVGAVGTKVLGLQLTGLGAGSMSIDSAGILVGPIGSALWPTGIYCTDGSSTVCFISGATSTGNNVSSMPIRLISRTAGAVNNTADMTEGPGGGWQVTLSAGAGFTFTNSGGNVFQIAGGGAYTQLGLPLASLAPTTNGTMIYCTDCLNVSNPCTASSTGAFAKRIAGAWDCR